MEEVTLTLQQVAQISGAKLEDLKALTEGKELKQASEAVFGAANTSIQTSLQKLKDKNQQFLDRGLREKGEQVEKYFRPLAEKLGVDDFKANKEGITLLIERMEQDGQQTVDLSKLTPEQISELPAYKSAMEKAENANNRANDIQSEFDAYKTQQASQATYSGALAETVSIFEKENAITGKATNQDAAKLFLSSIPAERLSSREGKTIVLDEQGQPLTDLHGNSISFGDYVRKNYRFGFGAADPNNNGSGADTSGSGGAGSGIVITSDKQGQDLIASYERNNDRKGAAEARKAYSAFLRKKDG